MCFSDHYPIAVREKVLALFLYMSNYTFGISEFKSIPKVLFPNTKSISDGEYCKFIKIMPVKEPAPDTAYIESLKLVTICIQIWKEENCTCNIKSPEGCDWCGECAPADCFGEWIGTDGGGVSFGDTSGEPPLPPAEPVTTGGGSTNWIPPVPPCPGAPWYAKLPENGSQGQNCDPSNNPQQNGIIYGSNIAGDFPELEDQLQWVNSIDTTGLDSLPCLKEIYRAISNSPTFYFMLKNFTGVNPTGHVRFNSDTTANLAYAAVTNTSIALQTSTITFSVEVLSHSTKGFAAITFIHEMIHADFDRILMRMGVDPSIRNSYPKVIAALGRYSRPEMQDHEFMANEYIPFLTSVFTEVDNFLGTPHLTQGPNGTQVIDTEYYKGMAWSGLQGTQAWNNLPLDKMARYSAILSREAYQGNGCN